MDTCPRCKQDSISRFAKFRALIFSHPACPACGARLSLHGAILFLFSAFCVCVLMTAFVASAPLVQWLPEPFNLVTGFGLGLALCAAPAALALRFAALKSIPDDDYSRLTVKPWALLCLFLVMVALAYISVWPELPHTLSGVVVVAMIALVLLVFVLLNV